MLSRVVSVLVAPLVGALALGPSVIDAVGAKADRQGAKPLAQRTLFGAFVADPSDPRRPVSTRAGLAAYERTVGTDVQVVSRFYGFGDVFPGATEHHLALQGKRAMLLSWDMGGTRAHRFAAWSRGHHDDYLRRVGRAMASYPHPLYVRPWPEMNADWVPFQPTTSGSKVAGGTPREFRRAWRHVVGTVRSVGATNVRWVFNPTADVYRGTTHVKRMFPGEDWVDVLGIDGYNWGNLPSWRSFADVFTAQYRRLTRLDPDMPVWLCEWGSREPSVNDGMPIDRDRSKGTWLRQAFGSTSFGRIEALVTFDADKERDWRLESSADALSGARSWLRSRTDDSSSASLPMVGVAKLAPSLRTQSGRMVVGWGRSSDSKTSSYRLQVRRSTRGWATVTRTAETEWRVPAGRRVSGRYRVQGLTSAGSVRWNSAVASLG